MQNIKAGKMDKEFRRAWVGNFRKVDQVKPH